MKTIYAVDLLFDKQFDKYIRSMWHKCEEAGVCSFMLGCKGAEPHMAVAVYEGIDRNTLQKLFDQLKQCTMPISTVYFPSVCLFKTTKVTFLNTVATKELVGYIETIHTAFSEVADKCSEYYKPEYIVPHVSLGKNDTIEEAKATFNFVLDSFIPRKAQIVAVELVEIKMADGGCLDCMLIDRFEL